MRAAGLAAAFGALALAALPAARATMMTSMQFSGTIGYELAGIASPGPPINASIALTTLPPGAMPLFAVVYTNDFAGFGTGGGQIDATLTPLFGPGIAIAANMSPNSSDPVPLAQTFGYQIGVPPTAITGNGSYGINIAPSLFGGNANQMAGAAMLVIYSHPLLPQSTITVNDGVYMMGAGGMPNSQSTTFQQLGSTIHAGAGSQLSLLTFADDPFNSGEQILFNNAVIGGPIDANLPGGGSASIFNFTVTSTAGSTNTVKLTSTGDVFGWHVAVLQTPVASTPEPSLLALAAAGLAGLALARGQRAALSTGRRRVAVSSRRRGR
jgi:hypothetical protein